MVDYILKADFVVSTVKGQFRKGNGDFRIGNGNFRGASIISGTATVLSNGV